MKAHKRDGHYNISTDHFIYACPELYAHLSFFFTAILVHGFVPDALLYSSIVSIPKGKNANLADSASYRGISLCSIFSKLFDNIVLCRYQDRLVTSVLQFGFKADHSTAMCSLILKESVSYYVNNGSSVFCTFLDATKAFDRVEYCKLFRLLVERKLPFHIIRVLLSFYLRNRVRVSWCGVVSDYFSVSNGVKQGGVLSPVLFCTYVDKLLYDLSASGFGCYIGECFVGALAYADDIVLLAPSATAMRKLLHICDNYASAYHVKFNALKSKCLYFGRKKGACLVSDSHASCIFTVGGNDIENVDHFVHLGHVFNSQLHDSVDIERCGNMFVRQTNNVLCYFSKLDSLMKYNLFKSYCTSFYGAELWSLQNSDITSFSVLWRKAIRRVWSLPCNTHSFLLPLISHCLPIIDELCRRFVNFAHRCLCHYSYLIRFVSRHCLHVGGNGSCFGGNLIFCLRRYGFNYGDLFSGTISSDIFYSKFWSELSYDQLMAAIMLSELIMVRDGCFTLSYLTRSDVCDVITDICVAPRERFS